MRGRLGGILAFTLLGISLLCYGLGVRDLRLAGSDDKYLDTAFSDPVSKETARQILDSEDEAEESYRMAFWREQPEEVVQWKEFGRSSKAALIRAAGQANLLSSWNQGLPDSEEECLLSEELARELFGNADPGEAEVQIGERLYQVSGTVKMDGKAVLLHGDEQGFDRLRVQVPEGKRKEAVKDLLEGRHGIAGQIMSYSLLRGIGWIVVSLMPLALFIHFIVWSLRTARKQEKAAGKSIFYAAAVIAVIWGCWLAAGHIQIPLDMIPTKWSDFSFWETMTENKGKELQFIIGVKKTILDQPYLSGIYNGMIKGLAALGLYFLWIICYTMRRIKETNDRSL